MSITDGSVPVAVPFNIANGVAEATTSVTGFINPDVICVDHDAIKNALPANAGFKKLKPSPPKTCFTTAIANAAPTTATHHGADAGKLKANNIPVTTALKSVTVIALPMALSHKYSVTTAATTEATNNTIELNPK
ncbi:hypothetical protein DSECCO2_519220 [anaerobic digester metagenome]